MDSWMGMHLLGTLSTPFGVVLLALMLELVSVLRPPLAVGLPIRNNHHHSYMHTRCSGDSPLLKLHRVLVSVAVEILPCYLQFLRVALSLCLGGLGAAAHGHAVTHTDSETSPDQYCSGNLLTTVTY